MAEISADGDNIFVSLIDVEKAAFMESTGEFVGESVDESDTVDFPSSSLYEKESPDLKDFCLKVMSVPADKIHPESRVEYFQEMSAETERGLVFKFPSQRKI